MRATFNASIISVPGHSWTEDRNDYSIAPDGQVHVRKMKARHGHYWDGTNEGKLYNGHLHGFYGSKLHHFVNLPRENDESEDAEEFEDIGDDELPEEEPSIGASFEMPDLIDDGGTSNAADNQDLDIPPPDPSSDSIVRRGRHTRKSVGIRKEEGI